MFVFRQGCFYAAILQRCFVEGFVGAHGVVEVGFAGEFDGGVHGEHWHAAVDDFGAAFGEDVGDGAAAAFVDFAEFADLPWYAGGGECLAEFGEKFYRPVVEIFAGIPSVVYGWVGLTVLVPAIKILFDRQVGHSILAAGLVLAVMIFPTITSVAADALHSVPKECRMAAYGLGSTRWQTIYRIVVPAAAPGIISGVILGLARAFGETLAVAMVIGQTTALPTSIFSTTKTLTTEIAAQMGNAMEGGEMKSALWTMALLLFAISLFFIFLIHHVTAVKPEKEEKTSTSVKTSTTAVPVKQFAAKGEN